MAKVSTPFRVWTGAIARHSCRRTERIPGLAESLRTLGPPYRLHGELMHGALRDGNQNTLTWHGPAPSLQLHAVKNLPALYFILFTADEPSVSHSLQLA
jgi:hypothetical protein